MKGRKSKISVKLLIFLINSILLINPLISIELVNAQSEDNVILFFNPRPNEPPSPPMNPSPFNGSVDVPVPVILSVDVYDETGDYVDVYFYNASNDTLIGVDYNVPSDWSTASIVWNETIKGRICYWYAIAEDHQFFGNASETWIFATRPNQPSIIHNNEYPQNTSENVPINVTCLIEVSDIDEEDNLDIYWYENSTGSWVERQKNLSVKNGTYHWKFIQAIQYSTKYWWKISVNDSIHNISETFHFTTIENKPLVISNPIPANLSNDVSIATSYFYINIEDPENDTINWTIETSEFIGNSSMNYDIRGQKACPLAGLQYNKTYSVFVNATDIGNGTWINRTYLFTTAIQGAPTISNENPANRNTHIHRQPTCQVDVHDIEGDNITVYWYENSTGSWILRQTDENITANSTVSWIYYQASSYSTTYFWRVIADDNIYNTAKIYHFTTEPRPSSPPPSGGGGGYAPPPNQHPISKITGPEIGYSNENLIFYAYYSYDPDGYITGYRWDFENDGVYDTDWSADPFVKHRFFAVKNYSIRLEVKDNDGAISTSNPHNITVKKLDKKLEFPVPITNGPYSGFIKENISFNSNESYDPDGYIINYTWDFGDGNISFLKNTVHSYTNPGNYTVILLIKDNDNLSNVTITKAIITIKEKPEYKDKEKENPLNFLMFLLLIIITTLIVIYFIQKRLKFLLMIDEIKILKRKKREKNGTNYDNSKKIINEEKQDMQDNEAINIIIDQILSDKSKK